MRYINLRFTFLLTVNCVNCSCRSDSMTSIKSYSTALPRDMSADRLSDPRYCDRLSNGRGAVLVGAGGLVADCNNSALDARMYQAPTQQYLGGGSPRVVAASTSIPYGVSSFCLGDRDASLQALSRDPPPPPAAAAASTRLYKSSAPLIILMTDP